MLVLKERAEVLEHGEGALHSERLVMESPCVIRLVRYVRVPRDVHRRKITRKAVLARDAYTCQYCGRESHGLTVDHVIPRSRGGTSVLGQHRRRLRALQPAQGQPAARGGEHAAPRPSEAAGPNRLHPHRKPTRPGRVGAVPAGRRVGVAGSAIVVGPGEGHVLGNVEFLARTTDTPRFNFAIIEIAAGRDPEAHVHAGEDGAFYIVEGELTFVVEGEDVKAEPGTFALVPPGVEHGFRNDGETPVRMLNVHAPAGFDRRIGLE